MEYLLQSALVTQADPVLDWIRALAPATLAGFLFWAMFARLTKQVTDMQYDIGHIKDTMSKIAIKNAEDHGVVKQELARLEERLNSFRSPWDRHTTHSD